MATRVIYSLDKNCFIACSEEIEEMTKERLELEKIFLRFFGIIKPPSWMVYWIDDKVLVGKMDTISQNTLFKFGISTRDLLYIDVNIFGKEEFKKYIKLKKFVILFKEDEYVAELYAEAMRNRRTQLIEPIEIKPSMKEEISNFKAWCFYKHYARNLNMIISSELTLIQELLSSLLDLYSYGIRLNIVFSLNDKIDLKSAKELFNVILLKGGTRIEVKVSPKGKPPRTWKEIEEIMRYLDQDQENIKDYFELEREIDEINKNPSILDGKNPKLLEVFISYNFEKVSENVKKEMILRIFDRDHTFIEDLFKKRKMSEEILNYLVDRTNNLEGLSELIKYLTNMRNIKRRILLRLINGGYYKEAMDIVREDKGWKDLLNADIIQKLNEKSYQDFCKELKSNNEMWEIFCHVINLRKKEGRSKILRSGLMRLVR